MTEKELFVKKLRLRTKRFAVEIIEFCESLKVCKASSIISYQIIKAATSVGANYRAACVSRSKKEFQSKICIVVEESDETVFWLEVIEESNLSNDREKLERLLNESTEITRIMSKAKNSVMNRH